MGLNFFEKVIELQKEHGRDYAVVTNVLQTNGKLIDDKWAAFLSKYRFLVGVSLDGAQELHDQNRTDARGKGSHSDVLKGIESLRRHDVPFNILVLVSASNVTRGRETYQYLRRNDLFYHQYIPCVEFYETSKGPSAGHTISGKQWGSFMCEVFDEWLMHDTGRISVRLFDSVLGHLIGGEKLECTMKKRCNSYFVVEYNGDVYPCDFFVEPKYLLGNIAKNRWHEMETDPSYLRFAAMKTKWNSRCDTCPHLEICAGDCIRYRMGEESNPRNLSRLCDGWTMFYDYALGKLRDIAVSVINERFSEGTSVFNGEDGERPLPKTKTGRNQPCPCGSGVKYKKCCGI